MIFFPFLFFSTLAGFWWYKHKGFDVCVYMAGLYVLTSFLSIILFLYDLMGDGGILYENERAHFDIIPTLLYCVSVGACLLPFSMLYSVDLKRITINSPWMIDAVSWLLIAVSFLNLYLVADSTLDILQGDLGAIRREHYAGLESPAQMKVDSMSFALKLFYCFNPSTILCLPIFFYNICFRKKSWVLLALLIFASLSCPIVGIQVADRTEIVFWGQMLLFCLVFFYPFLSKKQKWYLAISGLPIVAFAVVYLVAVSQSRFDRNGASDSGDRTIQYAGQGYPNFCYFFDNANSDYLSTEREFPFINHFLLHRDSNAKRREARSGEQGFMISVFPTYVGDLLLDISPLGMLMWVLSYFVLTMLLIGYSHREELDISEVLSIYILSIVPIFGIFYYRFFTFMNTFTFFLVGGILLCSKYKFVLK